MSIQAGVHNKFHSDFMQRMRVVEVRTLLHDHVNLNLLPVPGGGGGALSRVGPVDAECRPEEIGQYLCGEFPITKIT